VRDRAGELPAFVDRVVRRAPLRLRAHRVAALEVDDRQIGVGANRDLALGHGAQLGVDIVGQVVRARHQVNVPIPVPLAPENVERLRVGDVNGVNRGAGHRRKKGRALLALGLDEIGAHVIPHTELVDYCDSDDSCSDVTMQK
jgi:hypothetical protein